MDQQSYLESDAMGGPAAKGDHKQQESNAVPPITSASFNPSKGLHSGAVNLGW